MEYSTRSTSVPRRKRVETNEKPQTKSLALGYRARRPGSIILDFSQGQQFALDSERRPSRCGFIHHEIGE